MRYIAVLMTVLALAPLGCKKKPKPKVAAKPAVLPAGSKPITRLPAARPMPLTPAPRPIARPPVAQPKPEAPAPAPADETVYVVKKGDTLWSVSRRLLGDPKRYKEIMALNNMTSEKIDIGQKLQIPKK